MDTNWFIARDRKKQGPYSLDQMQQMARSGQLLPTEMVLQEGTTKWLAAAEHQAIFPAAQTAPPPIPVVTAAERDSSQGESQSGPAKTAPPPIPVAEAMEWHFSQGGSQSGPITMAHLKGMAEAGTLRPADLVWKAGMSDWVAASSIQGLFPPPAVPLMPPPLPISEKSPFLKAAYDPAFADCTNAMWLQDDYDRAIADSTEAIRLDPTNSSAYAKRGAAFRMKGDYDRAIADCTEGIRLNPNEFSAFADRGVAYRMKGDCNCVITDCTEAWRLKSLPGWKKDVDWWAGKDWWEWNEAKKKKYGPMTLKEFLILIQAKDITGGTRVWKDGMGKEWAKAEVMPELHAALGLTPKDVSAYTKRAKEYLEKKDYDRAIAECTEAIKRDPTNSAAYTTRGEAYRMKANTADALDPAIADLTASIMLDPKNPNALARRGACFWERALRVYSKCEYRTGADWLTPQCTKGITDLVESLRLQPDYTWAKGQLVKAYTLRAEIYFDWAKNFENAIADCNEAIRLEPTNAWAFAMRGVCYCHDDNSSHRNYNQAVVDLTEAIRLCPKASHQIRTFPNPYLFRDIDYKRELANATKKADPGKDARTIADLTEAIRIDPNDAKALAKRGVAYLKTYGNYDRAIADLNEAMRLDPNYEFASANLADIYDKRFRDACQLIVGSNDLWAGVHYRGKDWHDVTQQALADGIEAKKITCRDWLALARTLATGADLVVNTKFGKEDFRVMLANSLEHTKSVGGLVTGDRAKALVGWWRDYEPVFETIKADSSVLDNWYVNKDGHSYGPISSTDMCNFLQNENVSIDDEIVRIDLLRAKKLCDLGSEECNRTSGQQAVYSRVCAIRNTRRVQTIKNFLCGAGKVVGGVAIITGMVALVALLPDKSCIYCGARIPRHAIRCWSCTAWEP